MITLFGTWVKPSIFITEEKKQITVYTYREEIKKLSFPIDCFIQLDGNVVKNYILVK